MPGSPLSVEHSVKDFEQSRHTPQFGLGHRDTFARIRIHSTIAPDVVISEVEIAEVVEAFQITETV